MKRNILLMMLISVCLVSCKKDEEPQACFTYENKQELLVSFNSGCSVKAADYLWDFGDGTYSIEANPEHTFRYNAFYDVSLRITASSGEVISTVKVVKAKAYCYYCDCLINGNYERIKAECGTEQAMIAARDTFASISICNCSDVTYD